MNVAVWFGTPVSICKRTLHSPNLDTSQMQIPFFAFLVKEITIKSSLAYNDTDFKSVVQAFAAGKSESRTHLELYLLWLTELKGRFEGLETMVTSKIHIDDIMSKGFDELITNRDQHVKILVTPDRGNIRSGVET